MVGVFMFYVVFVFVFGFVIVGLVGFGGSL